MKATVVAILVALVTFTSGQGIQDLPECARTCVTQFTSGSNIGGCSGTDIKCICSSATFLSDTACCLAGKCSADDQAKATKFAHDFCSISGVTNLPDSVVCSSTIAPTQSATNAAQSSTTPTSTTPTSTSPTSSPTGAAAQNVARVGAGLFGAAMVALL